MFVHKPINKDDYTLFETPVEFKQSLNSNSPGIIVSNYLSASNNTTSGSYYDSLYSLFYLSGSSVSEEWNGPAQTITYNNPNNPQHLNKFDTSGSIISIPQQYYGETIKRNSFALIQTIDSKQVIIQDDGHGNLFSTNAITSQSVNSPSSSQNYVGNIFYELGLATITNKNNWSGSSYTATNNGIKYTDVTNPTITFRGINTIYTREYQIKIKEGEFNHSLNHSLRGFTSGTRLITDSPYLKNEFNPQISGSDFNPYVTQILLHDNKTSEPLIVANLPRAVKIRKDLSYIFKIRIDM
tara:strand:- start:61 stop:951 length:891 start_codon:yes stop_codon:yes gene_type:complete